LKSLHALQMMQKFQMCVFLFKSKCACSLCVCTSSCSLH